MRCYHIILLCVCIIQSVHSQHTDPLSDSDSVCISASANPFNVSISGRYTYLYFDPVLSATTYFNNETKTFLYPSVTPPYTYEYIISSKNRTSSSKDTIIAKCVTTVLGSHNFNFNPDIFFKNWQVKTANGTWIVDPNIRLVNCGDICIRGNTLLYGALFDGTYVWDAFDYAKNGSVFFCEECFLNAGLYLFGWVYGTWYVWEIQPVVGGGETATTLVYCLIGEMGFDYVFNLADCDGWTEFDGFDEYSNPDMTASKCSATRTVIYGEKVCVSGSSVEGINGKYIKNATESFYYKNDTKYYLYGSNDSSVRFSIGLSLNRSESVYKCEDMHSCFENWFLKITANEWSKHENMTMVPCDDVCISGVQHTSGRYIWSHFDTTLSTSVYNHTECDSWDISDGFYLYGVAFIGGWQGWRISDDYTTSNGIFECFVGFKATLGQDYVYDLNDCQYWNEWDKTRWSSITTEVNVNTNCNNDIEAEECFGLDGRTKMCVSGSQFPEINGQYISVDASGTTEFVNLDTNYYLSPKIRNGIILEYSIGSQSTCTKEKILAPTDCFEGWHTWIDNETQVYDEEMRLVECNDICVDGHEYNNSGESVDGIYEWYQFIPELNSSIYNCYLCYNNYFGWDVYLYPQKDVEFEWRINLGTWSPATNSLIHDNPEPLAYCVRESVNDDIRQCQDWYTKKTTDLTYKLNNDIVIGCDTPSPIIQDDYDCYDTYTRSTMHYGTEPNDYDPNTRQMVREVITGVAHWGVYTDARHSYPTISGLSFNIAKNGDSEMYPYTFGNSTGMTELQKCVAFDYGQNGYISGFRIIYDEYVHGLVFYAMNGKEWTCPDDISSLEMDSMNDSTHIFNNTYLSGVNINADDVVNSISFDFTAFDTRECSYMIFGIVPSEDSADATIKLTLFDADIDVHYQCTVNAFNASQFYKCNTLYESETMKCHDTVQLNTTGVHTLQIDSFSNETLKIKKIIIKSLNRFANVSQTIEVEEFHNTLCDLQTGSIMCIEPYSAEIVTIVSTENKPKEYYGDIVPQNVFAHCLPSEYLCVDGVNSVEEQCEFADKYVLVDDKRTYEDAQQFCELEHQTGLAIITNDEDLNIAVAIREKQAFAESQNMWVGLHEAAGKWVWEVWDDLSHCDLNFSYVNWAPNQLLEEHCAQMSKAYTFGLFEDANCGDKNIFLCDNPKYTPDCIEQPWDPMLLIIVLVSVAMLLLLCGSCIWYYYRYYKPNKQSLYIKNALVLLIGIAEYDDEAAEASQDINGYLKDLFGIYQDIEHMVHLFKNTLNYDVRPYYNVAEKGNEETIKLSWTEQELKKFLNEKAQYLSDNIEAKKRYDGLIVVTSAHGMQDHICTSDYKLFSKLAFHRIFTSAYPLSRTIPRVFLFDCCDGDAERERDRTDRSAGVPNEYKEDNEVGKNPNYTELPAQSTSPVSPPSNTLSPPTKGDVSKLVSLGNVKSAIPWIEGENNPDYRLALIEAANPGFQSKMRSDTGSYVVHSFYEQTMKSLSKNTQMFMHQIFDRIQDELHEMGKQHPVYTWNDGTRYIRFKKNGSNGGDSDGEIVYVDTPMEDTTGNKEIQMVTYEQKEKESTAEVNDGIEIAEGTKDDTNVDIDAGNSGSEIDENEVANYENLIDEMIDMNSV